MKKTISTVLAALLALPVLAMPPGRGHAHARRPPAMRAAPRRPMPPPPKFEPAVAGVLGLGSALLAPRYIWVEGHYESRATALPDGTVGVTSVWIPGRYVRVR